MQNYESMGKLVGRMVDKKNLAYGNSFQNVGRIMEVLFPSGISNDQIGIALAIVRILDKLGRIANDPTAFGEDPWLDIAGYAILMLGRADSSATDAPVPFDPDDFRGSASPQTP